MANKGKQHWTQTPEGKRKLSAALVKRHAARNKELTPTGKNPTDVLYQTIESLREQNQRLEEQLATLRALLKSIL